MEIFVYVILVNSTLACFKGAIYFKLFINLFSNAMSQGKNNVLCSVIQPNSLVNRMNGFEEYILRC